MGGGVCFASRRDFCLCSCRSIADIAGSEEGDLLAKEIMEVTFFSKAPLAFLEALLGRSRQHVSPSHGLVGRREGSGRWVLQRCQPSCPPPLFSDGRCTCLPPGFSFVWDRSRVMKGLWIK